MENKNQVENNQEEKVENNETGIDNLETRNKSWLFPLMIATFGILLLFNHYYKIDKVNAYIDENYTNVPEVAFYSKSIKYFNIFTAIIPGISDREMWFHKEMAKQRASDYYLENDPVRHLDCQAFGSSPSRLLREKEIPTLTIGSRAMVNRDKAFCDTVSDSELKYLENNTESLVPFLVYTMIKIEFNNNHDKKVSELEREIRQFKAMKMRDSVLENGIDYTPIIESKKEELQSLKDNKPTFISFEEYLERNKKD